MNAALLIICKSYRLRIKRESHGNPLPICSGHTNKKGAIKNKCKKCNYYKTFQRYRIRVEL